VAKNLTIFGSTGSIGDSTLDIVDACPDAFEVHALIAGSNFAKLAEQARRYRPAIVGLADPDRARELRAALAGFECKIAIGADECTAIADDPVDIVIAGIVGLAGLPSVLRAVQAGQTVALANKESLVSAGALVASAARASGSRILPLDSEHSAVFQCWLGWTGKQASCAKNGDNAGADDVYSSVLKGAGDAASIRHICLTASGGPFRTLPLDQFAKITPEAAVRHPNWSMGRKISVDSATMMNKGLEVIEAAWLFDLEDRQIEVLVHPQVAIHGMVYFNDGSVIGQLGTADMKTPISYALAWPGRLNWHPEPLNLAAMGRLDFAPVDLARYPCYGLARDALAAGGVASAVLNAANEVAVEAFLAGRIPFTAIADIVSSCLDSGIEGDVDSLDSVLELDFAARQLAATAFTKIDAFVS
jgi:1-deoxy-D-xylulose-5-phosphate reductoisomerase